MSHEIAEIIDKMKKRKSKWLQIITSAREMILSNLAMISQCPGQTFYERDRAKLIIDRFSEAGISEPTTDELHNAIGKQNGGNAAKNILLFTHMDNQFDRSQDQNISISEDRVYGAGVADDNLALAVLLTLPDIFNKLNLKLNSNLIFLASTRYHGRGDFGGIRHFVNSNKDRLDTAINIKGLNQGMIDYYTLSRVRCDIRCDLSFQQDAAWMRGTNDSAIMVINEVINSLYSILLPKKPKTTLNIGMISGGERYSTVSREAEINLEILSENDDMMDSLIEQIQDHCIDIGAKYGANVVADFFGRHVAAGLSPSHRLIKTGLAIIKELGRQPIIEYSNSEIAVPLSLKIPSVSLGITTGRSGSTGKSYIDIDPIAAGILQVIELIYAIDKEHAEV